MTVLLIIMTMMGVRVIVVALTDIFKVDRGNITHVSNTSSASRHAHVANLLGQIREQRIRITDARQTRHERSF